MALVDELTEFGSVYLTCVVAVAFVAELTEFGIVHPTRVVAVALVAELTESGELWRWNPRSLHSSVLMLSDARMHRG